MAHDAGVTEQACHVAGGETRHAIDIETGERVTEGVALAENRQPAESGLEAFQADLLEQPRIVGDRPAPLLVVVLDVERVGAAPPAARYGCSWSR